MQVNDLVEKLKIKATRAEARAAIIAIGKDATPTLLRYMKDDDFTIRWEMANVQGDIRDPRAVPALVENVLRDIDPHVRWRSIWALNEYSDRSQAIQLLLAALAASDQAARWTAAVGLSTMERKECLPIIHAGIATRTGFERWEAINALGRVHDEHSVKALAPVLESAVLSERNEATLSLGHIGGAAAVELLLRALKDGSSEVRWRAAMSLATARATEAIPVLTELRASDPDPMVKEHAEKALGALGGMASGER